MKIFRKSRSTKIILEELNQIFLADSEVGKLLEAASKTIVKYFDVDFCLFYIRETAYARRRLVPGSIKQLPKGDLENIRQLSQIVDSRVYVAGKGGNTNEHKILNKLLEKNDISAMVRLVSTLEYHVAGLGFVLLGPKKNSRRLSKNELKSLDVLSSGLIHIIENALRLEEIEQFNVTLQKKIDSATKELKANNDKLMALDEAKDEFVSMASHQLRTPLTSIKGYISMVFEGDAGKINDTQKQMLGQALFSSQRMVYLISDLLNVSRLRTGKFLIELKDVYLPDLVGSEIEQLIEGAKIKNLTMSFTKPKKFATLKLDDMKIRQVVMNFIDNAIYYTPNGGKITVTLKETAKSVEFRVKDTGIGVPKAQIHKLFTKFYRADNARKARPDGTGLGLFMAKKVIIAQGGSIIIESVEGKGSTFGFTFPKQKLQAQDAPKKRSS